MKVCRLAKFDHLPPPPPHICVYIEIFERIGPPPPHWCICNQWKVSYRALSNEYFKRVGERGKGLGNIPCECKCLSIEDIQHDTIDIFSIVENCL